MPKPIFLIGIPSEEWFDEVSDEIQDSLTEKWEDYHVLVHSHRGDEATFRVIYEKDFDEMKYEELKSYIKDLMHPPRKSFKERLAEKMNEQKEQSPE